MDWLEKTGKILGFMVIQYTLGRRGSFPYGLLVKFNLLQIGVMVLLCDLLQTVFLLKLFGELWKHSTFLRRLRVCFMKAGRKEKRRRLPAVIQSNPGLILVLVSALPFGGGALTGSLLATSFLRQGTTAVVPIMTGCAVGTGLYLLGFCGILKIL